MFPSFIIVYLKEHLSLRSMYLKKVSTVKQARNKTKALHPSTEFLFGGGTGELCQNLNNSSQLNPLRKPPSNKAPQAWRQHHSDSSSYGGFSSRFPYKKRGAFRARGGRGGARGGGRGKDLSTFKDN